jgi:hypothetical protein
MLNQTQAQSYSIQPGNFHDYRSDEMSARDAALESFKQDWESDLVSDARCQSFAKIDDVMTSATENLYDSPAKSEKLHRLLFALWSGGTDCSDLRAMLETELSAIMKEEFKKGTDRH